MIAIDNDGVLLLMLKEMFSQEEIHCDTCTDVASLMELIRKKEYSLLLTDLNMPEINGIELLELDVYKRQGFLCPQRHSKIYFQLPE